jgi:hypothetical protein
VTTQSILPVSREAGRGLVYLVLLDILEIEIYLGGSQLTNGTCIIKHAEKKYFLCVPFAAVNSICLCYDACFSYTTADQIGRIL